MADIALCNTQCKVKAKDYLDVELKQLLTPPENSSYSSEELTQCTAGCLHELLRDGFLGHRNMGKMVSCLQILIDNNANVNERDDTGKTPIYFAVINNFPLCAEKLLSAGAYLASSEPDNEGSNFSLATKLARTMPHVLLKALDNCVTRPDPNLISLDWRQIVHYKKFEIENGDNGANGDAERIIENEYEPGANPVNEYEPGANQVETSFLYGLLEETHEIRKTLFTHPLLSAYIDSKYQPWKMRLKFYYILSAVFSLAYMSYVYCLYFNACKYKKPFSPYNETFHYESGYNYTQYSGYPCNITLPYRLVAYIFYLFAVMYTVIEIAILVKFYRKHIKLWQTWITIPNLILMFLTLWPALRNSYDITWQYPFAAVGIVFSCVMSLMQLSIFPKVAVRLEILIKILLTIIKIYGLFIPLLIGFYLGFLLLFKDREFVFTYIIMTADLPEGKYPDLIHETKGSEIWFQIVAAIFCISFILIVVIVFMNFALGSSIEDVRRKKEKAKILLISKTITNLYTIDLLVFAKNQLKYFFLWIYKVATDNASQSFKEFRSEKNKVPWNDLLLEYDPNSSKEMPKDITKQLMEIISSRELQIQENESNTNNSLLYEGKLNSLSEKVNLQMEKFETLENTLVEKFNLLMAKFESLNDPGNESCA